jgi:hypothetical protein
VIHDSESKSFIDAYLKITNQALNSQEFLCYFLKEELKTNNSLFLFLFAVRFTNYPEPS